MKTFLVVLITAIIFKATLAQDDCGTDEVQQVPDALAVFPLNGQHGTREINGRASDGVPHGVQLAPGPDGTIDGSYVFAGIANSYIEFPNNGQLDAQHSMTMLCWVNPGGQDGPLFNYRPSGSWGVHLWIVAGKLFVRFTKRDYSFTNALLNTVLTPGQWKFVGASYDSATGDAKLWIDGAIVQTLNIGVDLLLATQDDVRMGVKSGDGRYFKGRITQMQIYNTALTLEEIQAIKDQIQVAACHEPLGMEDGRITDAQITGSSQWDDNHADVQGRLYFQAGGGKRGGWSARTNDQNQYLQVDLGSETRINMVATQGRNDYDQWVTSYKLQNSIDGVSFQYYNSDMVFNGNSDRDTVVYHILSPPIIGRYIRLNPQAWHGHISLRMELYGCPDCTTPLGMESGAIADAQISSSSQWDGNHADVQGRLNFQAGGGKRGGWSTRTNDQNQWLQVDLGSETTVIRVATQGRNLVNQWVTSYWLDYGSDGSSFQPYRKQGDSSDTVFVGNSDQDGIVYHRLEPAITARFIRLHPATYQGHMSLRMELYSCPVA